MNSASKIWSTPTSRFSSPSSILLQQTPCMLQLHLSNTIKSSFITIMAINFQAGSRPRSNRVCWLPQARYMYIYLCLFELLCLKTHMSTGPWTSPWCPTCSTRTLTLYGIQPRSPGRLPAGESGSSATSNRACCSNIRPWHTRVLIFGLLHRDIFQEYAILGHGWCLWCTPFLQVWGGSCQTRSQSARLPLSSALTLWAR